MVFEKVRASLSRVTTSGRFIPEIDGLRFLAITPVVLLHLQHAIVTHFPRESWHASVERSAVARLVARGHYGVELFFVISGFILALPFAEAYLRLGKPVALKKYFLRRVTRLEPPYLVMLALCTVLAIVSGADWKTIAPHLGANIVYMHNVVFGWAGSINRVAWSLEIEIQFYVLAPLLARVFLLKSRVLRRVALAVGTIVGSATQMLLRGQGAPVTLAQYLQWFLVGMLAADLWLDRSRDLRSNRLWDLIGVASVVIWMGCEIAPGVAPLLQPWAGFVLFIAVFRGNALNRLVRMPWVTAIGGMCYSIYLIHSPLIPLGLDRTAEWLHTGIFECDLVIQAILIVTPVLLVSAVFYLAVERPCMRADWPQRLSNKIVQICRPGEAR